MEDIDCPPCSCDGHMAAGSNYCTRCDEPACMDCAARCGECEMWICYDCMSNDDFDEDDESRLSQYSTCPDCHSIAVLGPIQGVIFCNDCGEEEETESVWWHCCGDIICDECHCSNCNAPEIPEDESPLFEEYREDPSEYDLSSLLNLFTQFEDREDETKREEARVESASIFSKLSQTLNSDSSKSVSMVMGCLDNILHRTTLSKQEALRKSKIRILHDFSTDGPEYREWWFDNSEKIRDFLSMMIAKNGIISLNDDYFEHHLPSELDPSYVLREFERNSRLGYHGMAIQRIRNILHTMKKEMALYEEYRSVWLEKKVRAFPEEPLKVLSHRKNNQLQERELGPIENRSSEHLSPDIAVSRKSFDWNPIDLRWEVNKSRNDLYIELKAELEGYRDSQSHSYCGSIDCFMRRRLQTTMPLGWVSTLQRQAITESKPNDGLPWQMKGFTVGCKKREVLEEEKLLCPICKTDADGNKYHWFLDYDPDEDREWSYLKMSKKDVELERRAKDALSKNNGYH